MSVEILLALTVTLLSACALNIGYLIEHSVVKDLPPLSGRRPVHSLRVLLGNRRWLLGFGIEAIGWALYVLALALAPLSLVQATAAGGIGILALMVSRWHGTSLSPRERIGVVVAVGGLGLLGLSLSGGSEHGEEGTYFAVATWLVVSVAAAAVSVAVLPRLIGGAAAYGLATGITFAAGDVATKTTVEGHVGFAAALVACYAIGTILLQSGFQRGSALTTAGVATLFTNALPIAAGMTIFHEPLPGGWQGALRVAAFSAVVVGAVFLADTKHGTREEQLAVPGDRAAAGATR
jgi:hypothetical protein